MSGYIVWCMQLYTADNQKPGSYVELHELVHEFTDGAKNPQIESLPLPFQCMANINKCFLLSEWKAKILMRAKSTISNGAYHQLYAPNTFVGKYATVAALSYVLQQWLYHKQIHWFQNLQKISNETTSREEYYCPISSKDCWCIDLKWKHLITSAKSWSVQQKLFILKNLKHYKENKDQQNQRLAPNLTIHHPLQMNHDLKMQ